MVTLQTTSTAAPRYLFVDLSQYVVLQLFWKTGWVVSNRPFTLFNNFFPIFLGP